MSEKVKNSFIYRHAAWDIQTQANNVLLTFPLLCWIFFALIAGICRIGIFWYLPLLDDFKWRAGRSHFTSRLFVIDGCGSRQKYIIMKVIGYINKKLLFTFRSNHCLNQLRIDGPQQKQILVRNMKQTLGVLLLTRKHLSSSGCSTL